ncbi:substrate-binding domain-containing protein [Sorangium sp. So ce118]
MQMAIVLKSAVGFWTSVVTAANRAMGELEVTGTVIGPLVPQEDPEVAKQLLNEQIEQTVADGAEGLGIAPLNDDQAAAVDEAIAKGIHVVTLDTDVATSKRAIHVCTLDRSAGATAGETLLAMLPPAPAPGTVILHGNQ